MLVLNAGSSSLKYRLFRVDAGRTVGGVLASGAATGIGDTAVGVLDADGVTVPLPAGSREGDGHSVALKAVMARLAPALGTPTPGPVTTGAPGERSTLAVGHRVVHGGAGLTRASVLTPDVIDAIRGASALAPLHNPSNLAGIAAATAATGNGVPHVAVFDTAFHATLPAAAYTYALPVELAAAHGVRRYGFHGTSYAWAARHLPPAVGVARDALNAVVLHLGAGASAAVLRHGVSVDTSMGLTPGEGLIMATRAGDIDAGVVTHLQRHLGMTTADVDDLLTRQSGLAGLAGTPDMRAVLSAADAGDANARLALDAYAHRVRRYLGAYLVELGGNAHVLAFTAGVGEGSPRIRAAVCHGLERLGIELDAEANEVASTAAAATQIVTPISTAASRIRVVVVRTDEEREIATQVLEVLRAGTEPLDAAAGG